MHEKGRFLLAGGLHRKAGKRGKENCAEGDFEVGARINYKAKGLFVKRMRST